MKYSDLQFPEIIWIPISAHGVLLFLNRNLVIDEHCVSQVIRMHIKSDCKRLPGFCGGAGGEAAAAFFLTERVLTDWCLFSASRMRQMSNLQYPS